MTSVMNEKLARNYIKNIEDKLLKKVRQVNKKMTIENIQQIILELLPCNETKSETLHEAKNIIQNNQELIVDQQKQINYLKRKENIQNQLTASFFKCINKEKDMLQVQNRYFPNKSNTFLQIPIKNFPSTFRCEGSTLEPFQSRVISVFDRSPIGAISKFRQEQPFGNTGVNIFHCRSPKDSNCRNSEIYQDNEFEDAEKVKALKRLRKLEKYVFEKENIRRQRGDSMILCGVSPSKMRYKQENQNLKAIQSNLVTHLTLMEKFKAAPAVETLVAKQEALKKKEKSLKQLNDTLSKKQFSLNKKHSDFLKKQRSLKVL